MGTWAFLSCQEKVKVKVPLSRFAFKVKTVVYPGEKKGKKYNIK